MEQMQVSQIKTRARIACEENPPRQATIAFDDYPRTPCAANWFRDNAGAMYTCGASPQKLSWTIGAAPSVVSAVSEPANTYTATKGLVSITGTLLNGATLLNLIPTANSNIVVISVAPASVSATAVMVCGTSAMTSGNMCQVTMTTTVGTGAAAAVSLVTY